MIRPEAPVAWHTIGTALDYRVRYYFRLTPPDELVAWHGAKLCSGGLVGTAQGEVRGLSLLQPELVAAFFAALAATLEKLSPVERVLDRGSESELARYCYVLGLFDEVFRAGPGISSPLWVPSPRETVPALLDAPPPHAVDDLCALSEEVGRWFRTLASPTVTLNPTFEGSIDVGGADADLIVDGCLIDIKTTATIPPRLDGRWLYQLLGYALLDYSDEYHIREVGLLMPRQRVIFKWALDSLMARMRGERAVSLAELRAQFKEIAWKSRIRHLMELFQRDRVVHEPG